MFDRIEIIARACETRDDLPAYDPTREYMSPAAKHARPGNFWKYQNPTQVISRAGSDAPEEFVRIAEHVVERAHVKGAEKGWKLPEKSPEQIIGTMELMYPRSIRGAFGEASYIAMLEAAGETVLEPEAGDEGAGIDIRTDRATYQVKTTTKNPLDCGDSRDELIGEADHLIWVRPDGTIEEL